MLKKTVSYTDYNGVERTEDCYFNITKAEAMEMQFASGGNLVDILERIIAEKDQVKMGQLFKDMILKTYGVKSDDGRRFMKSPEISAAFEQSPAYDQIYMELLTDTDAAIKFVNGIVPPDIAKEAAEEAAKKAGVETNQQVVNIADVIKPNA